MTALAVRGRAVRPLAVVALMAALAAPAEADRPVPFLSGRVVDEASLLDQGTRDRIELRLRDLEQATGAQVAVLTVGSLQGDVLEQYTLRVADTWKLGGAERDDGVLVFVARDDRKMRIEVGYGLEDRLTDLQSRRILDDVMGPRFKAGNFGAGIEEGVKAVESAIHGRGVSNVAPVAPVASGPSGDQVLGRILAGCLFTVVVGVFSVLALGAQGKTGWLLYLFLMPFHCLFPIAIFGNGALFWFGAWVIGFPLARALMRRTDWGRRFQTLPDTQWTGGWGGGSSGSSWSSGGSDSSWSSSSSSSSSGSSFSGGGGSFGGGGASSSW